jgi:glycine dehydrogenase
VGERQSRIMAAAVARGINLRDVGSDRIGISVDETTTEAHLEAVCAAFDVALAPPATAPAIPEAMLRSTPYLTHPIFHMNRAESEMMRYMRRLSDRDLALDRAMIPLGSCTMKLNAAVEMMPVTWPEFNSIHPFAPADQAQGYAQMLADLSAKLCEITGYDAMSMQPNSGRRANMRGC